MTNIDSEDPNRFFTLNLRNALPYLEEFQGGVMVFLLENPELSISRTQVLEDLVLLNQVGIHVILVHGPGEGFQDQRFDSLSSFTELSGSIARVNWDIQSRIRSLSRNVKIISGHFIDASPLNAENDNHIFCNGTVTNVDTHSLHEATASKKLVIIPTFGIGEKGRLWFLDSAEVAMEVAAKIHAKKLINLGSEKCYSFKGLPSREMKTDTMRLWLEENKKMDSVAKRTWEFLVNACERGVERCHDLDVDQDGSVLTEILTSGGVGLMITNNSYRRIRSARISDLQMILRLLNDSENDGNLVKRSEEYLRREMDQFFVFCIDDEVVGCFELQQDKISKSAVLGGFVVGVLHRNQGVGRDLVKFAIEQARLAGSTSIFALTTVQSRIFLQCDFQNIKPEELPEWKLKKFDHPTSQIYRYCLEKE